MQTMDNGDLYRSAILIDLNLIDRRHRRRRRCHHLNRFATNKYYTYHNSFESERFLFFRELCTKTVNAIWKKRRKKKQQRCWMETRFICSQPNWDVRSLHLEIIFIRTHREHISNTSEILFTLIQIPFWENSINYSNSHTHFIALPSTHAHPYALKHFPVP